MSEVQTRPQAYICPMHAMVREPNPGKCPKCGMALVPEGSRFALLRHMASKPWMLLLMIAIMVAVMWTIMTLMRS